MLMCNLPVLLAERNLKISKVSNDTGISRTTLTSLNSNYSQGIQFDTLNKLCNYLKVKPGDLFLYIPYDIEINVVDRSLLGDDKYIIFNLSVTTSTEKTDIDFFANIGIDFNLVDIQFCIGENQDLNDRKIENENLEKIKKIMQNIPIQFLKKIDSDIDNMIFNELEDFTDENTSFSQCGSWEDLIK